MTDDLAARRALRALSKKEQQLYSTDEELTHAVELIDSIDLIASDTSRPYGLALAEIQATIADWKTGNAKSS